MTLNMNVKWVEWEAYVVTLALRARLGVCANLML